MQNQTPSHQSTIGPLRWSVPSATTRGVTYEVSARTDTGELVCNCLARRVCWHIKATAAGAIGKPRVRITAVTRPAPASPVVEALPITAVMVTAPYPGPSPATRERGASSPFQRQDDGVTRAGRGWRS